MKAVLELYKRGTDKKALHPLVIRFIVNRKTYRFATGVRATEAAWMRERKTGYSNSRKSLDLEEKAQAILNDLEPFNYQEFCRLMGVPFVSKDSITKLWPSYDQYKDAKKLKKRTREIDTCVKKKLLAYLEINPAYNNIHAISPEVLGAFHDYMIKEGLAVATAEIYLEALRTFFNWAVDEVEILVRSPFKKYTIPKSDQNWFPYNLEELKIILGLKTTTDNQKFAMKWTTLLLYSGGSDPIDFSTMKWKHVQSDVIQMFRVKVSKSSAAGKKLLYLTGPVKEYFTELNGTRGSDDDYVLDVYKKDKTDNQNLEYHKRFLKRINIPMQKMIKAHYKENELKGDPLHFTVKRLRPTAAVMAMASTKDLNFVSGMLSHSNISQTNTYIKHYPSELVKINQEIFEEALKKASQ